MRYSPQREEILNIFRKEIDRHFSVDEIFSVVRQTMPKISLATVYRNLKQMQDLRLLTQMQGLNQEARYEIYKEPHHHFICKKCGDLRNLDNPSVKTCTSCVSKTQNLQIDEVFTTLIGICANCQSSCTNSLQALK